MLAVLALLLCGALSGASAHRLDHIVLPRDGTDLNTLLAALAGVGWFRELVQRLMRLMHLHSRHLPRKSHYSHQGKLLPPRERWASSGLLVTPMSSELEKMRNGVQAHAKVGREERHKRRTLGFWKHQRRHKHVGGLHDLQMAFAELWDAMGTDVSPPLMWSLLYLMHYITFRQCEEDGDDDDDDSEDDFSMTPSGGPGPGGGSSDGPGGPVVVS
jgi:hypothetical protein